MVDICLTHGRMPIVAVSRLHLMDPSSIEHNSACLTACLASIRFESVSHSSLLVVVYQLDRSATIKMRKLCEINEITAK